MNERRFNNFDPAEISKDSFITFLEQKGFQVVEASEADGDKKVSIAIPEGRFQITAGFPEFDAKDKKFFYGNNVVEMQHHPLELDFENPRFQELANEFRQSISTDQGLDEIVANMDEVIQDAVRSDSADERISKMSEILAKGRSACTGKVLVSSGLLKNADIGAETQLIYGASNLFGTERPHNIGHVWLRIARGDNVVLYDPYFKHMMSYELPTPSTIDDDPFAQYEVGAYCAANVINQIPFKSLDGRYIKIAKEVTGGKTAWIQDDYAFGAQVFGEFNFDFETKASGKLTLVNGGMFSARGGGAGFNYPLKDISKIS